MWLEDMGGGNEKDDKAPDQGVNSLDVFDQRPQKKTAADRNENIPVGLRNAAPETDDAVFYSVGTAGDGTTLAVGPFKLTAEDFKAFKASHSTQDLDALVDRRALRPSTALSVKSNQFDTILTMMESGQKPTEALVKRFLSGDLQRVIESEKRAGK
jgi:hypothetical protein